MMSRTRVLVIGYEPQSSANLANMLRNSGYEVSERISPGKDAFVAMDENKIEVAIIRVEDSQKENSIKLGSLIWILKNIPVVYIDSSHDAKFLKQVREASAFGYIAEPFEAHILKSIIEIAITKAETEKKLRIIEKESQKYSSIVENANVPICIIASNKFEYLNPAFEALIGYSSAEVAKNFNIADLILPEDRKIIKAINADREKSKGKGTWFEFRIMSRYHEIKTVESMMVDIKWGNATKIMGIMHDVTERKRMEEMVKLSEEYYKGMFDNADDAILIFSPENEIVIDVNPKACKMYGFPKDEFEGMSLESISKNVARGKSQIEEILKKEVHHNFETVQFRKDGTEMCLEVNASVLTINGKKAILCINHDITERKAIEQQLKASLQRVGSSLGGIIRAISIILEKRNPYTAGHHSRVANLAFAIAKKMGIPDDESEGIKTAALIHDLGMINVPEEILTKPEGLNPYEWEIVKSHPRIAYEILKCIEFPWPIAEMVYQHHERLNGTGYPTGLKGDEIRLEARIIMIANVVEAVVSPRSYRPAQSIEKAMEEITSNRDKFYDSKAVYACVYLFTQEHYNFE